MSCRGEIVLGVEDGLLLLPSDLFDEVFYPFPQIYRRGSVSNDRYTLINYRPWEKPSDAVSARQSKPRGTGVFLPARPAGSSEEMRLKRKPCPPVISSHSRKVFLPKEWAY